MSVELTAAQWDKVEAAGPIEGIKRYRAFSGLSLKESMHAVQRGRPKTVAAEPSSLACAWTDCPHGATCVHAVSSIPDHDLVLRALVNARTRHPTAHRFGNCVEDTFSLGSGFADQLCERFGFDPNSTSAATDRLKATS